MMRSRSVRRAGRCIGLVAMAGASGVAHAQEVRTSLTASTGMSAETNPYNDINSSGVAVAATAELRPVLTVRDETTSVALSGLAQFRQFLRRYGLEDNYGFNADISTRVSESLTVRGNSAISYSEGGYNGFGRPGLSGIDPSTPTPDPTQPTPIATDPLLGLSDVSILGRRTRVTSIGSGLGADLVLGARSSLSLDLNSRSMRFKTAGYDDYSSYSAQLSFSHQLDELFSVGLIGTYSKTNYLDLAQGDAGVADALVTLNRRFGARWTLFVGVGASFTTIDGRAGRPDVHFSAVSARFRFCWRGELSNVCLGGQRSPQPAAGGNVRVSNTVTADYTTRLSERESFSLSGSYAKTERSRAVILGAAPAADFISAQARYDNQFSRRIGAFASANVSKITSPGGPRRANVGGAIGLQIRIGAGQ